MAERYGMTIKLAWDNTNPIVSNKGGVKSYLGSMIACEEKLRTIEMYPIMISGALNLTDTPRAEAHRYENKKVRTLRKARAILNKMPQVMANQEK